MKLKKVLAAVLTVAMVLSFANIAVFAEESDYTWTFTIDNDYQEGLTQLNMGVGNIADGYIDIDISSTEVTAVESSNPSVADVYAPTIAVDGWYYDADKAWDEMGNLYIKGFSAGVAYITQTFSNGNSAVLVVVVGEATYVSVTSVTFADNIYSASMYVGDTATITAVVSPNNATYQGVVWSTDDESVATVSDEGVVTAVGVGTANIKAVSAGPNPHSATRTITVTEVPKEGEATVIETAKSTGATITLNNLADQSNVKLDEDATYKVVVSTAPAADVAAANEAIKNNDADTNTEKAIFDISVMKTDSNGTVKDVSGDITNQTVTLTLAETPADATSVHVYHVDGTTSAVSEINPITVTGNTVTFVAPSFSTYAVTYTAAAVDENDITGKIGVVFSPVAEGSNQYYITLKSLDGKKIYRYMSADIAFKNNCATVGYDIEPAVNMIAAVVSESGNSTEYRFEMDGANASSATSNDGITIGTITFYGYGTLDFSVDKAYVSGHSINIVNTALAADNIVDNYTVAGDTLIVNDDIDDNYPTYLQADESGTITDTLSAETKDLTVNIAYNNTINNNVKAYQDMKVVISGGDLANSIEVELGSDNTDIAFDNDKYTFVIEDTLTKNVAYTVTVKGAGYRTARYIVTMTENKVLNFWNNVKDSANATVIETGKTAMTKNFLAGDIVKDNNINIYDLSAVVSYFGTENLVSAHPEYAKYDLNRDGVIDSKDVAYVLVSWGE